MDDETRDEDELDVDGVFPIDPLDPKKKGLLDDDGTDEDVESLDDLKDDELAVDKEDLMDDVEDL